METEFYKTNSNKEHSVPIPLSNGKNIRFSENSKAENPKFTVKVYEEKKFVLTLGSVFREEIDMTVKALKQLSIAYYDDITFLSRAKTLVSGNPFLYVENEEQLESLLKFVNKEFN